MSRRKQNEVINPIATYTVKLERSVRYTAEVEVKARSERDAKALALDVVDAPSAREWQEQDVIDQDVRIVGRR